MVASSNKINVVVIGAGVTGLTTALLLAEAFPAFSITVVAKHMPADHDDPSYASPWAGANFIPAGKRGSSEAKYEEYTYPVLCDLVKSKPEAGIHFQETRISVRASNEQSAGNHWYSVLKDAKSRWKETFSDFRDIPISELPAGIEACSSFTSVVINVPHYLQYLISRLLALGVVLKRASLENIRDAQLVHHSSQVANLIINCTGLGARFLGGVIDKAMSPARGQTVLVRNTAPFQGSISSLEDTDGEVTYLMTRAAAGGTILGGCYQKDNWSRDVDEELAKRIMKRAVEFCPELVRDGPLDVISHNVGFRPVREGGVRVERESLHNADGSAVQVVHNYGHGGGGYQMSYGCSVKVVELVNDYIQQLNKQPFSFNPKL